MSKEAKLPSAEDLLAIHLTEMGVRFRRQHRFCEGRKWAADFMIGVLLHGCNVLIEVDGFDRRGRHGAGWGKDYERDRTAAKLGFFTLRFTTKEVLTGKAKTWIQENLLEKA